MDWDGDVPAVRRTPCSEPEMDRELGQGALAGLSYRADSDCRAVLSNDGWADGQRDDSIEPSFLRSSYPGTERSGKAGSYGRLLLGLCVHEPAPGPPLGDGAECAPPARRDTGMDSPGVGLADSGLWRICVFKRGFPDYLLLQTHFLFLDYEEPILFFFLDYLTIMGLFIFCAHYGGRLLHRKKNILKKDD